jgi:hypothetical protein
MPPVVNVPLVVLEVTFETVGDALQSVEPSSVEPLMFSAERAANELVASFVAGNVSDAVLPTASLIVPPANERAEVLR